MNKITRSKEDYLRVLLELSEHGEGIHSMDVADTLKVTRASVSRTMKELKAAGYVIKEKYGTVTLTERGLDVAVSMKKRRDLLKTYITDVLGVESSVAEKDACQMEHLISEKTEEKIRQYLMKINQYLIENKIS